MSLVIALFLVVVVASLAAFAINVGGSQQQSGTNALLGDRAVAAARAGVEWAAHRALINTSCVASSTLNLNESALRGFRVTVTCAATNHAATPNFTLYDITSTASYGTYGTAEFVSRQVKARFTNPP
jgi:MSHA biogenesis protein MshP